MDQLQIDSEKAPIIKERTQSKGIPISTTEAVNYSNVKGSGYEVENIHIDINTPAVHIVIPIGKDGIAHLVMRKEYYKDFCELYGHPKKKENKK